MQPDFTVVADIVARASGRPFEAPRVRAVGGGCINRAYRLSAGDHDVFVKINERRYADMFAAEAAGLAAIAATDTITVPTPIGHGVSDAHAFLILPWLDLHDHGPTEQLGAALAALHNVPVGDSFGWTRDNYIGTTPQANPPCDNWHTFFREQRLEPLFAALRDQGVVFAAQAELYAKLPALLGDHQPQPSLVHGDLWQGNAAFQSDGTPVVFDVAVYHGDAEVDLAMSELFGNFGPAFFVGYQRVRPISADYPRRRPLYNLYHLLNHALLFGGSYISQVKARMQTLL